MLSVFLAAGIGGCDAAPPTEPNSNDPYTAYDYEYEFDLPADFIQDRDVVFDDAPGRLYVGDGRQLVTELGTDAIPPDGEAEPVEVDGYDGVLQRIRMPDGSGHAQLHIPLRPDLDLSLDLRLSCETGPRCEEVVPALLSMRITAP